MGYFWLFVSFIIFQQEFVKFTFVGTVSSVRFQVAYMNYFFYSIYFQRELKPYLGIKRTYATFKINGPNYIFTNYHVILKQELSIFSTMSVRLSFGVSIRLSIHLLVYRFAWSKNRWNGFKWNLIFKLQAWINRIDNFYLQINLPEVAIYSWSFCPCPWRYGVTYPYLMIYLIFNILCLKLELKPSNC